jgi:hypothetical protein
LVPGNTAPPDIISCSEYTVSVSFSISPPSVAYRHTRRDVSRDIGNAQNPS